KDQTSEMETICLPQRKKELELANYLESQALLLYKMQYNSYRSDWDWRTRDVHNYLQTVSNRLLHPVPSTDIGLTALLNKVSRYQNRSRQRSLLSIAAYLIGVCTITTLSAGVGYGLIVGDPGAFFKDPSLSGLITCICVVIITAIIAMVAVSKGASTFALPN